MDNAQEASEKRCTGSASSWTLPRLVLIGDGFTDSERADRIVVAVEETSGRVFGRPSDETASGPVPEKTSGQTLWVHLRDRAASAGLFRECTASLVERLRNASPSILLSVNGRPEVAEALQCGYHAGVRDAVPGFSCGSRQPYGRSVHNPEEARAAMGDTPRATGTNPRALEINPRALGINPRALGTNPCAIGSTSRDMEDYPPQYLLFSPVFSPQGKPGYAGAGIDTLRGFVHYVQGRVPVYALGGITPERVRPCLDAGSYGVAVLSGIMRADHPGKAADAYLNALRAYFEDAS